MYNHEEYEDEEYIEDDPEICEQSDDEIIDTFITFHSYDIILFTEKIQNEKFKCSSFNVLDFIIKYILFENINSGNRIYTSTNIDCETAFNDFVDLMTKISRTQYIKRINIDNNAYINWVNFYKKHLI